MNESLSVPDAQALTSVQALCDQSSPYAHGPALDQLFVEAMRENLEWHVERCEFYRRYLELRGFNPSRLRRVEDCADIPFLHANFFKTHEVLSIDRKDVYRHLTSSGTTGQKSQIFFDRWSLESARRMVDFTWVANGWESAQETNYVVLGYEPQPGFALGTADTFSYLCRYAPVAHRAYALRRSGAGTHEPAILQSIDALVEYQRQGLPLRMIGFPAYLYFILEKMRELGVSPLKFPEDSLVFLGGGWKGYADKKIEKDELYRFTAESLGFSHRRVRASFGSVEHSIPYIECEHHRLHVPVWSRVFVRDVWTLEPLAYGQPGFLHFVSPYITSVPAASVLMGDLASLHPGTSCPCGIGSDYFEVLGRAGTSANRTCAAAAAELLQKGG